MIFRVVYITFIGVLLATFVGVGIAAFYPAPLMPTYPAELKYPEPQPLSKDATQSPQIQQTRVVFDNKQAQYNSQVKNYNRDVCIFSLIAAIMLMVISLTAVKHLYFIADGILLGGVLTLMYSIGRGFGTDDNKFRFVVLAIGLVIAIVLGYIKFNKQYVKRI